VFDAYSKVSAMTDMTIGEFVRYVLPLVLLGIYAGVEEVRLRRWTPNAFRSGICVYRRTAPLRNAPREVPLPHPRGSVFWSNRLEATRLGATEIAFVYPAMRKATMRGLVRFDPVNASLEMTGRLNFGFWALFAVGFTMAGMRMAILPILGIALWTHWGEREHFAQVFAELAARV
jgi:hypothetical protein